MLKHANVYTHYKSLSCKKMMDLTHEMKPLWEWFIVTQIKLDESLLNTQKSYNDGLLPQMISIFLNQTMNSNLFLEPVT